MYVCMHACMGGYIGLCMNVCNKLCLNVCMYPCTSMNVCTYLLTYLLTYLFTYLLIYLLTYLLTYLPTYLPYQKFDRLVTGTYQKPHPQGAESMQKLLQPQMLARQSDRSAPERPQRHSRDTQNGSHWIRKHLQMIGIFLKSNKYNYIYIYTYIYVFIYLLTMYHRSNGIHPMAASAFKIIQADQKQMIRSTQIWYHY